MKISELARGSGVPVTSLKYYLREGMLMPGRNTSATQAEYTEEHVRRVRLIRTLTHVVGLPIQNVKVILGLIDRPGPSLYDAAGAAIEASTPSRKHADAASREDYPRARAALERLGQVYNPDFAAVAQLEDALQAVEEAGLPLADDRLAVYGEHMRAIAEAELEGMPRSGGQESIEYAVLGTSLYEPVLLALRRLAHQHVASQTLDAPPAGE